MKLFAKILFVAVLVVSNLGGAKGESKTLNAGFDAGYPPYEYVEDSIPKGFLVDLLQEIGRETGFSIKFDANAWDEVLRRFEKGKYDVMCMFYTDKRADRYALSDPFINITHSVFYRRGAAPINSIEDLAGKKVLVEVSPLVQAQFLGLSPKSEIIQVEHPSHAVELMLKEGYDYAVLPNFMAYYVSNRANSEVLIPTKIVVSTNKYCFAVNKDSVSLLQQLNEGIHISNASGAYLRIYKQWFGNIDNALQKENTLLEILRIALPALAIIVLLAVFWSIALRRQVRLKTLQLQRELEQKIIAEHNYLRSKFALDNSVDCIFGISKDGNLIYVNDAASKVLGYSKGELLLMDMGVVDGSFKKELWEQYWERIKSNEFYELKTIQRKKDQSVILVEGAISYFEFDGQEFAYAVTRDVTDKLKLEESLKSSEELFRNVFANSPTIMFIADVSTLMIADANKAAIEFYGYTLEEFRQIDITYLNRLPKEKAKDIADSLRNSSISLELVHYKKNGEPREVTISSSTVKIADKDLFFTTVIDNTDKNFAIKQLKDSEEKFSKTFMTSPDAIFVNKISDGTYAEVNESYLKMMGYSREEVIGKTYPDINIWVDPIDRQEFVKELRANGECLGYEAKLKTKDGEVIYTLMSASIMEIHGEGHVISTVRDITKKKQEDIYLQALYQISDAAISTIDFQSLCQKIHSIVSDLMPAENLYIALYDHETEFFEYPYFVDEFDPTPEPRKRLKGLTEIVIDTGEAQLIDPEEFYKLVASGQVDTIGSPSIDWLGVPLKASGIVIGAIVVQSYTEGVRYSEAHKNILSFVSNQIAMSLSQKRAQEELVKSNEMLEDRVEERTTLLQRANEELEAQIEERVRIEKEIRESEERFRLMADSAPVIIWMTDSEGMVNYLNNAWIEFTGKTYSGIIDDYLNTFIHPDDHNEFLSAYQESTSSGAKFEVTVRLSNKAGEYRYVLLSAIPRLIDNHEFHGFIGTGVDITELQSALEQEKELNALKTSFISTVSHEYRTPLTTILTSTYLIDTFIKAGNADEAKKFLDRIQMSVKSMTLLLEQILTISRSDTGRLPFKPVLTNVYDFCLSLTDEMKIIDTKKHKYNMVATDNVRNEPLYVDPNLLHQIMSNLVTNAAKYSPDGTDINISLSSLDHELILAVEDNGIGIPKEQIPHLFDPFFRASNCGVVQGTGLGMPIVKRCVDTCGGNIHVESLENKGTTITVAIPISEPETDS